MSVPVRCLPESLSEQGLLLPGNLCPVRARFWFRFEIQAHVMCEDAVINILHLFTTTHTYTHTTNTHALDTHMHHIIHRICTALAYTMLPLHTQHARTHTDTHTHRVTQGGTCADKPNKHPKSLFLIVTTLLTLVFFSHRSHTLPLHGQPESVGCPIHQQASV